LKQKYNLINQAIVFDKKDQNTNTKKIASIILLFIVAISFFNLPTSVNTVKAAPPASYIDIDSTPFSRTVTQAEFNVANEIWFRFVTAEETILGGFTNSGGTFLPTTRIFESDGSTVIISFSEAGWWYQLDAGTYYIRVTRQGGGASNFDFTSNFKTAELNPAGISNGSYLIPDDSTDQLAATVYEPDGDLLGFFDAIPTGEIGDALPSGHVLLHDRFGRYAANSVILFGPDLSHIATITPSPSISGGWPRIVNDGTSFYVINTGGLNWGDIFKVEIDGSINKIGTIPLLDIVATAGISRDGDIVYWTEIESAVIKRYRISTAQQLSDLYTIAGFDTSEDEMATTPNINPGEIIVLGDDSLVTWWTDWSDGKDFILHLSSDGTLLNTIEYDHPTRVNHMHYSGGVNPNSINIWYFLDNNITEGRIGELDLTTGTLSNSFDTDLFYEGENGSSDPNEFGPSNSCPFVTMGYSISSSADYDLEIDKEVDDATPDEDDTIVYTITFTNNGPDAATDLEVDDALPAEVTYVSSVASQGSYDQNTEVWTVGDLNNAEVATLDMTVTVNSGTGGGSFDNTATGDMDADSSINTSTVSVTVNTPVSPPSSGGGGGFIPPPLAPTPTPVPPPAVVSPPAPAPIPPPEPVPIITPPSIGTPVADPSLPRTGFVLWVIPGYATFYLLWSVINRTARKIYLENIRIKKVVLNHQWLT
jgi:uncharacterized repeat protein (TIGR01451 family)